MPKEFGSKRLLSSCDRLQLGPGSRPRFKQVVLAKVRALDTFESVVGQLWLRAVIGMCMLQLSGLVQGLVPSIVVRSIIHKEITPCRPFTNPALLILTSRSGSDACRPACRNLFRPWTIGGSTTS